MNTVLKKFRYLLFLPALLLVACEDNGESIQSDQIASSNGKVPIYRSYSIVFNEADNRNEFVGKFNVNSANGARVLLVYPSLLRVNNRLTKASSGISSEYALLLGLLINPVFFFASGGPLHVVNFYESPANNQYRIDWTDPNNNLITDQIMLPSTNVSLLTPIINKNNLPQAKIAITGYGFQGYSSKENLEIRIYQNEKLVVLKSLNIYHDGMETVSLDNKELQEGPAKIEFRIEKTQNLTMSKNNLGGKARLTRIQKSIPINIQ